MAHRLDYFEAVRLRRPRPFSSRFRDGLAVCNAYRGSLGARNWELIQPFKGPLSTCTQSPSRLATLKRVPLGAVPRTLPVAARAHLTFALALYKKTTSTFSSAT